MSIAQSILANPEKYSLEQLTQGVENGVIPAYIGVPIIQEMLQKQSQAAAMGGQQMPPVMDQVMAQAAQGLETLPSNLPESYAGGGIIAFSPGGLTGSTSLTPAEVEEEIERASRQANQAQTDPSRFSNLRSYVDEYRSLMPEKDPRIAAYEASIMKTPEQLDARKKQDMNLALAQFGLNLMGSKSRTLAGGIGEAGAQAMPSVQAAMLSRRTAEDAALKAQADLARGERAEGIAALQGGLGLYGKAEDRISEELRAKLQREAALITGNKPTDMVNYVNTFVRNAQADPANKKSADALALEGYQKYFTEGPRLPGQALAVQQGIAGGAQAVQAAGQDVTREGQAATLKSNATKQFNDLGPMDPIKRQYFKLAAEDKKNKAAGNPTTLADQYRQREIDKMAAPPASSAPAAGQPQLPPGVPPGSTYGKKVAGKGTEVIYNGKVIGYAN
jgi:hypothetical protein